MGRFGWWVVGLVAATLSSCGGQAEHKAETPVDTVAIAPPRPPEAASEVSQLPPADEAPQPAEYIVRGVCPFECCKYGTNWTLVRGGALRSEPDTGADSVGAVATGATVHTDEGVMVLNPPGVAVVAPDTSVRGSSGPGLGDTVEVITYTKAKVGRVRWHGQEVDMNWGGLRLLRDPVQQWWVHMTDPATGQAGWLPMAGVNAMDVGAPNSCSKTK